MTYLLIVINCLVFLGMLWHGAGLWHVDNGVPLAWGANFGPATQDGEWWRLGSAMFLHFGVLHLGMNMLSLWDGGRLVERMYGPRRFLLLYIGAGLLGNLVSLMAQGDKAVSAGASGAIFGIYGAFMSHLWLERKSRNPGEFKRLFWGAFLFSALAIALGIFIKGIDNHAHVGGLVGGVLLGLYLARPEPPVARRLPNLAGGVFLAVVGGVVTHLPAPPYLWSEEQRARLEIRAFMGADNRLNAQWQQLMGRARQGELSFDELAGQIDSRITASYEASFEQLSRVHLDPSAPSAQTLAALRQYAESKRDAARALAEQLREQQATGAVGGPSRDDTP
ncbi:MAG: rhomboid family intramembrane serine protease [Pseudomonadota bacterium]